MDSGTWVKCTICDGYVSQVLFLAQRGINGNDKALGMMGMDKVGCLFQVQSMHRMTQSSVDINSVYFLLAQLMTSHRLHGHCRYRERSVQTMDPDDGECIFLEERQFR